MEDLSLALASLTSLEPPKDRKSADGRDIIVANYEGEPESWIDMVPLLTAASDEMKLGDMLEAKCFDLQDAMSAIEMFDAQMDAGMRLADPAARAEDAKPLPELPATVPAPLTIAFFDQIMCAEHGWYSGLTLTQSIYAIEFMMTAPDVEYLPLRAAFLATARAVAAARMIVLRGDIHEEEDFSSTLSGLKLHDECTDQDLAELMKETERECAAALAAAEAAHAEATMADEEASGGGTSSSGAAKAVREATAILARTRFRRGYCGALLNLTASRPSAEALSVAYQMLTLAEAQLDLIGETADLGVPRAELGEYLGGRAVRKRLGSTPTKRPELISVAEGVSASRRLIQSLKRICLVPESCDDYDGLAIWLEDQANGHPAPNVLTRSATQLLVVSEDRGGAGLRPAISSLLAGAIAAFNGLPSELMVELLSLAPVEDYMTQVATGELSRLRLLNVNRARQRRRLRHYLQDWAPLQEMAESLDLELQQAGYLPPAAGPFGAWALHRTLRDMRLFLRLGFENELFAPCEFLFAYWYEDLLCGMQLQLQREIESKVHERHYAEVERIEAERQAKAAAAAAAAASASGGKKKGKKKDKDKEGNEPPLPPPPDVGSAGTHLEMLFARLHLDLCRGCYHLLAALEFGGFLPKYAGYAAEMMPIAARFEHRFQIFGHLRRPPPLSAEHFQKERERLAKYEVADLLAMANSHFKAVKARLEPVMKRKPAEEGGEEEGGLTASQRAEATRLIKVSVANSVLILSMGMKPPAAGSLAKLSFASHPHFVTVSFSPPKSSAAPPVEVK